MAELNIREIIKKTSLEIHDNLDLLSPETAARKLVDLASLGSSLNAFIAAKDKICRQNLNMIMRGQEKRNVAAAKIELEATEDFNDLNEAKLQADALGELIKSLKYFVRANERDILNQRNL